MPNKLGANWYLIHRDQRDWDADNHSGIFMEWQPPTLEISELHFTSLSFVESLFAHLPTTLFVFRDIPLSDDKTKLQTDPVGLAKSHAAYWGGRFDQFTAGVKNFVRDRVIVCGLNEPPIATDAQIANVVIYNATFLDELTVRGIRGAAGRFSVGWPRNTGKDTRVEWGPFGPMHSAILRGNHVLALNEYWGTTGPDDPKWLGWHADRLGQCPWTDVRIVVTECGLDQHALDPNVPNTGFRAYMGWAKYAGQLEYYNNRIAADPRVLGGNIFLYDRWKDARWDSFDVRPERENLLLLVKKLQQQPQPAQLPIPRYPANVTNPLPVPGTSLKSTMWQKAKARQLISPNPNAALEKAAWAHGYRTALGNEFQQAWGGVTYVCQHFYKQETLADGTKRGRERVYYVKYGDWGNVQYFNQ